MNLIMALGAAMMVLVTAASTAGAAHGPRSCGAYYEMNYICIWSNGWEEGDQDGRYLIVIWWDVTPCMDWWPAPYDDGFTAFGCWHEPEATPTHDPPPPQDPGVYLDPGALLIPGVGGNHGCEAFSPAHPNGLTCQLWGETLAADKE